MLDAVDNVEMLTNESKKKIVQLACLKKRGFTTNPTRDSTVKEIRAIMTSPHAVLCKRMKSSLFLSLSSHSEHFFADTVFLVLSLAFEAGYQKLRKITKLSKHVQRITIPFDEQFQKKWTALAFLYTSPIVATFSLVDIISALNDP